MAAEIVGSAFVRIRALTKQLSKEIKDGVDKGIKDAKVGESGEEAGDQFSEGFGESTKEGIPGALDDAFNSKESDDAAREGGESGGESWNTAFHRKLNDSMGESITDVFIRSRGDRERDIELGGERDGEDYGDGFERGSRGRLSGAFEGIFGGIRSQFRRQAGRLTDFLFDDDGSGGGADRKGASLGRRFLGGLTGSLRGAASLIGGLIFNPVVMIAGLVGTLGPLLINLIVGIVGQLGTVVNAALGGGIAIIAGLGAGLLSIIPLIAAFTVQTPLLELFKEEMAAIGEELKVTAELVQEQVLPGVILLAETFIDTFLPAIDEFAVSVGDAFGDFLEALTDLFETEDMIESITNILEGSAEGFRAFLQAMVPFVEFVIRVFEGMIPIAKVFADDLNVMFTRWRDFAENRGATGLTDTFMRLYDTFKLVLGGVADLVVAVYNVLAIGDESIGQGFFEGFREFAREFREFTTSESGIAEIQGIFERAQPILSVTWDIIQQIGGAMFSGATSETATGGILAALLWIRDDALPYILNDLIPDLKGAFETVGGALGPVVDRIKPFAESMVAAFSPVVQEVMDYYIEKGPEFRDIFLEMLEALEGPLQGIAENLVPAFESFFDVMQDVQPALLEAIAGGIVAIAIALERLTSVPGLSEFLGTFLAFALLATAVSKVATAFAALKGALAGGAIMSALAGIGGAIITVAAGFGILITLPAAAVGAIAVAIAALVYLIITNWGTISQFISDNWAALVEAFKGYQEDIGDFFRAIGAFFTEQKENFDKGIAEIKTWFQSLGDKVGEFRDRFGRGVDVIKAKLVEWKDNFWLGIDAIKGFFRDLRDRIGEAVTSIREKFQSMMNKLSDIKDRAREVVDDIVDFFKKLPGRIMDHLGNIGDQIKDALTPDVTIGIGGYDLFSLGKGANGGIFSQATPLIIGEAGKEVLIPLTRPARAMELAIQSGLFDVLGQASARSATPTPFVVPARDDSSGIDRLIAELRGLGGPGGSGDTVQLVMPAGIGASNAVAVAHATVRELRSDKWRRGK